MSLPAEASRSVILFAYYYPPDNTSGVQRAVRIAKYLPTFGHPCDVVCSSYKGMDGSLANAHHVPSPDSSGEAVLREERLARRVQRWVLPYNEELPWVPHAVSAAEAILAKHPVRAVISTSPPVATHLAAYQMKRRHGLRWIADFRDPIVGNPGRSRAWARPYDAALQRLIFRNADVIVAVTDAVADDWRRAYPTWKHKIHVIWNGYDPADGFNAKPLPDRPYRLCSHVGVLYALRHPIALLSAFHQLIERGSLDPARCKFNFLGPVQNLAALKERPEVRNLIQAGALILRDELVPRSEAMDAISTSDYLLLIDIVNLSRTGYTVPAKLYDYVLAGRPILALTQKNAPVDRILARSGPLSVPVYHDDSPDAVAAKLLSLFTLPTDPVPPGEWFTGTFNGERQAEELSKLL